VSSSPPDNHEDLDARLGLDPQLRAQLEQFNILYDRDGDGEYFQLVSRAFAKRFFFEIVERRGYRGFGVANAAIRLSAQSRYRDDLEAPVVGSVFSGETPAHSDLRSASAPHES
jgi:4-hydroxyphenylpyruvate dioxygenase